jgi:hypothetical protein
MFALDLFNTRYERQLQEGGVDNLEARRIDDLNMKMQDLLARAKEPAYKKNPGALAGLKRELEKIKDERDSYYKVREAGIPGNLPADQIPGKEDLLKGKGRQTYESETEQSPRAYGVANFQRLVKANMGNLPTVDLEFIRPEENFKLDKKGLDLISDYYDGLESDQAKNYFIYRVLPSGEETLKVLKQLGYNQAQQQPTLPGIPTQGELPLSEKQSQKKNDPDDVKSGDAKTARQIQKIRAQYPAARTDIEALAQSELDSTARSQQQLAAISGANEKQDALLKQLVDLDKEQGREIDGLDQENNSLEQRLAQVQATNNRLQQAIGRMTGTKKATAKTKTPEPQGSRDIAQGGIIDVGSPVAPTSNTTTVAPAPNTTSAASNKAMKYTSQQIQGLGQAAPDIRGKDPANDGEPQTKKVSGSDINIKEHGGGIGPKQHWQDLMQETVSDVKAGMADIYRRLAPKIERHRDSFLAGQLYDELENYAELHGAEREFKQMMNGARNRAHMEYDTNPGGFHNWFWFLPFEDNNIAEDNWDTGDDVTYEEDDITGTYYYKGWKFIETADDAYSGEAWLVEPDGDETSYSYEVDEDHGIRKYYDKQGRHAFNLSAHDEGQSAEKWLKAQASDWGTTSVSQPKPFTMNEQGMAESNDDVKKRMSKLEALALAANRAGDDAKCKMYQQKIQALKQKLSQSMAESSKSGEYYIHTVYFKDGTKKRIRVTSDEFNVADYYTKRGQAVDRVDYDFQLHSDMTEAEKEPTTRQELLDRVDKIQRMMSQERNPANLQILRKELEMLKQRYQHLKEDNDSEAVERAILNRIMVAHTDLLMKYGPEKVMQAAEEVSYNVGDVDEIGTSDVSAYVNQVRQILGAVNETQVNEKWTAKYKSSINCANPKGFSQKAHCAGRKK